MIAATLDTMLVAPSVVEHADLQVLFVSLVQVAISAAMALICHGVLKRFPC